MRTQKIKKINCLQNTCSITRTAYKNRNTTLHTLTHTHTHTHIHTCKPSKPWTSENWEGK